MYSHFFIYVLLERTQSLDINFLILPKKVFSIFSAKSTIPIHNISVIRLQILMTPGFVVSEYKVQGAIFQIAILDLHHNSKAGDKSLHKRFYSTYFQLSRLQILDKVKLLQLIILENIKSKSYLKL